MKNDLVVIDKIDKQLRAKRTPIIFPLSPTHRKELRNLRNKNIGDLRERLIIIKKLKQEEYIKKYYKNIESKLSILDKNRILLNDNWLDNLKI